MKENEIKKYENKNILEPLENVKFVDRDLLKPNNYNPNKVSEQNLELLVQSILTNGWTMPIVIRPDYTIIDGFHRWTVSGREPLNQPDKNLNILYNLISNIKDKYENKDIWIYSGDIYENDMLDETKSKILSKCDVLVDGPFIFEKRDLKLPFKGSSNQRVIDLKHSTPNNVSILL